MSDDRDWRPVGRVEDWPAEGARVIELGARRIGVYRHQGRWYALKDICPHAGVGLARGPVQDRQVMCVGHGWRFDLETGDLTEGPKGRNFTVAAYPVRERDGVVEVGL